MKKAYFIGIILTSVLLFHQGWASEHIKIDEVMINLDIAPSAKKNKSQAEISELEKIIIDQIKKAYISIVSQSKKYVVLIEYKETGFLSLRKSGIEWFLKYTFKDINGKELFRKQYEGVVEGETVSKGGGYAIGLSKNQIINDVANKLGKTPLFSNN